MRRIFITCLAAMVLTSNVEASPRRFLFRPRLELPCVPVPQLALPVGIPDRNMVNLTERNLPTSWSVEEGKLRNIKWSADVGDMTFGSPVVANGKVFVATNNSRPRDLKVKGRNGVLMAFRAADGQFLWQIAHGFPDDRIFDEVRGYGLFSTPTVSDGRLYYVTPGCEVVCAACEDGAIHWQYDMRKHLKVTPFHCNMCSPLVVGDLVYVVTGNGVDEDRNIREPQAPSFVALNKKTGTLVWQSNLPGKNIIEAQWSSPTFARVNGAPQVIFAGGDCVIYGFEPNTGKLLWQCDCLPNRVDKLNREINLYIIGAPVVVGDRLFVGLGVQPGHPHAPRASWFLCLDISRNGDVSLKSYDAKAPNNNRSALVWAFGGPVLPAPAKGRQVYFGSTMSTPAIHDGLVYISEENGYLHCLDAKTGQRYWEHDLRATVWGSPYFADGKVYLGTEDGQVLVFAHGKTKTLIATNEQDGTVYTTPTAANGVLYVLSRSKLYAIDSR